MKVIDVGCGGNPDCYPGTSQERAHIDDALELSDPRLIKPDVGVDIRVPTKLWAKEFVKASVTDLSMFADKEFDMSIASHVLEHMPNMLDLAKALNELKRISKVVHIWVPTLYQFGFTNSDHHLMWMKGGFRPFNRWFRRLLFLAWTPVRNRYVRWFVGNAVKVLGLKVERHRVLEAEMRK